MRRNVVGIVEAKALESEQYRLAKRFTQDATGALWWDCGDSTFEAIKITPEGWSIEKPSFPMFRRYPTIRPLTRPADEGDFLAIKPFLYITGAELLRVLCWTVSTPLVIASAVPTMHLLFHGPPQATKTTASRVLRYILDPSTELDDAEAIPRFVDGAIPFEDNRPRIGEEAKNDLCRSATGASVPHIITSLVIPFGVTAELKVRTVEIEMTTPNPEEFKRSDVFFREFRASLPSIMRGLLDTIVKTLARSNEIQTCK